jgi:hypothetical protein
MPASDARQQAEEATPRFDTGLIHSADTRPTERNQQQPSQAPFFELRFAELRIPFSSRPTGWPAPS